jgi:hypothetical protein
VVASVSELQYMKSTKCSGGEKIDGILLRVGISSDHYIHRLSLDLDRRRLGDLDLLLRLFLACELSRLLCSSSFRFPAI